VTAPFASTLKNELRYALHLAHLGGVMTLIEGTLVAPNGINHPPNGNFHLLGCEPIHIEVGLTNSGLASYWDSALKTESADGNEG
jgi:hypothetical protein